MALLEAAESIPNEPLVQESTDDTEHDAEHTEPEYRTAIPRKRAGCAALDCHVRQTSIGTELLRKTFEWTIIKGLLGGETAACCAIIPLTKPKS